MISAMKALVYTRPMNVEMRELDAPQLRDSEVLVRVRACGVCGSDLHGFRGNSSRRVPPLVLGHEFSGDIIENRCSTRELSVSAGQRNVAHEGALVEPMANALHILSRIPNVRGSTSLIYGAGPIRLL